jgi:CspA family cold shock protein
MFLLFVKKFKFILNYFTKREIYQYLMLPCNSFKVNTMQKEGTVKFFNNQKGFGFISQNDTKTDVFVHSTGLIDQIRENDQVSFNVEDGKKGPSAVNVKVI